MLSRTMLRHVAICAGLTVSAGLILTGCERDPNVFDLSLATHRVTDESGTVAFSVGYPVYGGPVNVTVQVTSMTGALKCEVDATEIHFYLQRPHTGQLRYSGGQGTCKVIASSPEFNAGDNKHAGRMLEETLEIAYNPPAQVTVTASPASIQLGGQTTVTAVGPGIAATEVPTWTSGGDSWMHCGILSSSRSGGSATLSDQSGNTRPGTCTAIATFAATETHGVSTGQVSILVDADAPAPSLPLVSASTPTSSSQLAPPLPAMKVPARPLAGIPAQSSAPMAPAAAALSAQTVSWSPDTTPSLTASSGGGKQFSPSAATSSGSGAVTYAVASAGNTYCRIGSSSPLTVIVGANGTCSLTATAAATSTYESGSKTVAFTISGYDTPEPGSGGGGATGPCPSGYHALPEHDGIIPCIPD